MKRYLITTVIAAIFMALPSAAQEYEKTPVTISKEKVRIDGQVCYSHIVLEKQTLFSICEAYGVTEEDIYKYNPSVKTNGLKKNSILIIPINSGEDKKEEAKAAVMKKVFAQADRQPEKQTDGHRRHVVKWYETIDDIAARYGVSAEAIMKANNLTGRKLTKRQKLIIPNPGEYADIAQEETGGEMVVTPEETETTRKEEDGHQKDTNPISDFFFPKKEVNVSLLLPLKATGTESSRQNMDFYSGVLLAVYDLSNEGIGTNLNVYDIAGGNLPSMNHEFANDDIIIGPVAAGDISRTFAANPQVKGLVSPLDPRAETLVLSNDAMIHAPTPHSAQYIDLVAWMKDDMKPGDRVLFITEKGAKTSEAAQQMTAAIDSSGLEYSSLSYSILEGRNVTETMGRLMTDTNTNRVYIASESEAFVNDVVRNLNVMIHKKYDVVLYAPSKIRGFETIEVENFHNTSMHVSTGYYIDYDNPRVMEFLKKYRALFNTEPTQFAFQGYDLARYFISLCSRYGNRWMYRLDDEPASMLQSSFDFTRTETGGYVNNGVRRIVYGDNWSVRKVK